MPGRHLDTQVLAIPETRVALPRPRSARVLLPRIVALALLVAAVGAIAGLSGYTRGRASIDQDAVRAQAYAAGHAVGMQDGRRADAAAAAAAVHAAHAPASSARAVRAAWAAGHRAGVLETSYPQRAHGRALGAAAALGSFAGGWSTGRWYLVRPEPGGSLTAGRPRIVSRIGPLAPGQSYVACQGGAAMCRAGGAVSR